MTVSEATTPSLTVRLIRPADQLDLLLELLDVTLDPVTNQLEGVAGGEPRLRVILGAQHTSEDALADVAVEPPVPTPLKSRTAGPSRLVTSIQTPIAFTVDALLDTAAWVLNSPTGAGTPSGDLTALELPSGLLLAPDATASVTTTGGPRTDNGVTELWRADLRSPTSTALPLLALANVAPTDGVDNAVPDSAARDGIVDNTTTVAPATAPRLTLSSHGAFARLAGDWPDAPVSRWRQTIVTGRDVVAEVVQEGYLLPFGHRVKILEVNSRRFVPDTAGQPTAVLEHERFVSIDAPTVVFDDASDASDAGMEFRQFEGRGLPFAEVDAVPTEWIPIDTVELHDASGAIPGVYDLVVKATGQPLIAAFDATDRAGNGNIGFSTPATFVDELEAFTTGAGSALERLTAVFADPGSVARRTLDLSGQAVAFADEIAAGLGKTTFATNQIVLNLTEAIGASTDELADAVRLGVFPTVESARIVDEAMTAALGGDALDLAVALHDRWLEFGLDAGNFDLAFLKLDTPAEKALGGAGRAVAAVDLVAEAFNQTVGAGLDLEDPTEPWSPDRALGTASRILGMIPLSDILPSIDLADAIPGVDIPGLEVSVDENGLKATFTFTPAVQSVEALGFQVPPGSRAFIENVTCVPVDGQPENTLTIRVEDVTLQIPPIVNLVELTFSEIEVVESTTDGLIVDPKLEDWTWGSLLAWLKPLTDLLDKLGDGLIDITPEALEISTDVPLPEISLGVVSISNVAIFSGLDLPFIKDLVPTVALGLGSAASPVEITVLAYGAAFYIEVDISPGSPSGLRRLTASLELEAMLYGFDIVVASADITLRVSALFKILGDEITFRGSVALEGNISVLGLLDVSVGIVASLTYKSANDQLVLSGRLTYSVDTFLGGTSGSVPIGKMTFDLADDSSSALRAALAAGPALAPASSTPAGPPSFGDRFTRSEWRNEYTAAFA
jgi:hypothetical protein